MLSALHQIASTCRARGIQLIVDAESQAVQPGIAAATLDVMRRFNHPGEKVVVYNTYQAYLKSTPGLIEEHMRVAAEEGFTLGLKLVRGAYIASEDRKLIWDSKQETDRAYDGIAQGAIRRELFGFGGKSGRAFPKLNLLLASHNRHSVMAACRLHGQRVEEGLPTVPVAYAQLQGMSDEVSFSLLAERDKGGVAPEVFKCTTWGSVSECVGYLLRRAVENRDAVLRTKEEFGALRREVRRRFLWGW